jgi:hypothetical protein
MRQEQKPKTYPHQIGSGFLSGDGRLRITRAIEVAVAHALDYRGKSSDELEAASRQVHALKIILEEPSGYEPPGDN